MNKTDAVTNPKSLELCGNIREQFDQKCQMEASLCLCSLLYFFVVWNKDDHNRNPNMNNRDHLDGYSNLCLCIIPALRLFS